MARSNLVEIGVVIGVGAGVGIGVGAGVGVGDGVGGGKGVGVGEGTGICGAGLGTACCLQPTSIASDSKILMTERVTRILLVITNTSLQSGFAQF